MDYKSIRAFVALPLSLDCRQRIKAVKQDLLSLLPPIIRWVNVDYLHVTLKFFGEFDPKLIPNFSNSLKVRLTSIGQFDLKIQNLGVFPNKNKPKVIWVGLDQPYELGIIFREIENAAVELGYPKDERGFSPHVTIGRVSNEALEPARIGAAILNYEEAEICISHVDQIIFFQSTLRPEGPIYSELFQLPLDQ